MHKRKAQTEAPFFVTFRRGEVVGGDNLTTSTLCWLATKKTGRPFSLCPPPITNAAAPKRSRVFNGRGGTGGDENTSSGDWRRFCVSWKFWVGSERRVGGEAAGGFAGRKGNTQCSGLDIGKEFLKFSKLLTGFSWNKLPS